MAHGQCSEGIGAVTRKVMNRCLGELLHPLIEALAVVRERLNPRRTLRVRGEFKFLRQTSLKLLALI